MTTRLLTIRRRPSHRSKEAGQTMVFLVLVLGLFLLGSLCLAFDLSNMWFHRQAAQNAADAACTAGAMDLLVNAQGGATGHSGFTAGTAFQCTAGSTIPMCKYAAKNGYDSANTTPGNLVSVSFPGAVPGVTKPPTGLAGTYPFLRVDVLDHVQTFFVGLLNGGRTADVRAMAVCGLELATSPVPIIVLDPQSPQSTPPRAALNVQGNGTIAIVGGPTKSIQVNSGATAGSCGQSNCSINLPWGSAKIDLTKAGPNKTGADLGLWGAPATAPGGFLPGTTGHWVAPAAPIGDPFAQVCAPGQTGCASINGYPPQPIPPAPPVPLDLAGNSTCNTSAKIQAGNCKVAYTVHGCPDKSGAGCTYYNYGLYPTGIRVNNETAIFDPGVYYLSGLFDLRSNSIVRPGNGVGDGSGGTTFYFQGSGITTNTVQVASNSGSKTLNIDAFNTATGSGSLANGIKCTATSTVPSNIPATINGNILLGPCTGYYGDPLGAADPLGIQRGFLFFQDRSSRNVQPLWGGGGQFLLAGTMYFHSCNATGTGVGCGTPPTYYNDIFELQGNSGSGTYVFGQIVADNLTLGGTSGITMDLNPTAMFSILKASLLQ